MSNKYYKPDISEFHVGFEYFVNDSCDVSDGTEIENFTFEGIPENVKVKYLDREDIESLGFNTEDNGECYNLQIRFDLYGLYPWENNRVQVTKDMKTLFNGIIKNKSELKKVLTMLNINKDE